MIIDFNDLQYSIEKEMENKQNNPPTQNKEPSKDQPKEQNNHMVQAKKSGNVLFDKLQELPAKTNTLTKKFRLWLRQRKNLGFYKRYLDRVQGGLYNRYGNEARVKENNMVGDPVEILKGPAQTYIRSIVKNINNLYETVLKMANDLESKMSVEAAIPVIQTYCKDALTENVSGKKVDQNKLPWKEKILNATKYKIAKILMSNRDTGIYGYTAKNMVLKGYPKPNHLIVTLFVEDPEEYPQEQSVTDIFKSADSFSILADSDKQDVFNVANMMEAVLSKTVDNKVLNDIKENKNKALMRFKNADIEDKKDQGKILDSIWEGINASCKELLSRKAYLIDCINIYFDMIMRIDNLGVKAIQEMLDVEAAHSDKRYNKSLNVAHTKTKDRDNKYRDDYDPDKSTAGKREQYRKMNETAKKLNRM